MTTATTDAPAGAETRRSLVAYRDEPKEAGLPSKGIFLLVGDEKVGKSTFAAAFPDSYTLALEKHRSERIKYGRIDDSIEDLAAFGDVLELAINEPTIKTIVIDTIDVLAKWIADDIAKTAGIEFLGKVQKGVDNRALWGEFAQRVHGLTEYLESCGKLVIVVAHRRAAKLDDQSKVIKAAGINVSGQGGDFLAQRANVIGYIGVRVLGGKTVHYLSFRGESDRAIWRSGIDELRDQEVVIPETDPYGAFAALFGEKTPERPKPALKAATKTTTKRK